jgi:hypothetical protein
MYHASNSVLECENRSYFTFFILSIGWILMTCFEISIIEMVTSREFHMECLLLSAVKLFVILAWLMHLRWDRSFPSCSSGRDLSNLLDFEKRRFQNDCGKAGGIIGFSIINKQAFCVHRPCIV